MSADQAHPLIQFVQTRGRFLLTGALVVAIALTLTYRLLSSRQARQVSDFIQAELELQQLAARESEAAATLHRLDEILGRHAELHQKYDGPIAQSLLKADQVSLSEPFADSVLHRTKPSVSTYAQFTEASLLIGRNQYAEALANSQALQEELSTSGSGRTALRLNNLIRIAFLCEALGDTVQEHEAWLTLLLACESPQEASPARDEVLEVYTDGQVSVLDYARMRLAALSSNP